MGTQRQAKGCPLDLGQAVASSEALAFWFLHPESLTLGRQGVSYLCKSQALERVPSSLAPGAVFGGLIKALESGGKASSSLTPLCINTT